MKVISRYVNGVSMSEVQTKIASVNISTSKSNAIIDRITPGLAIKYVELGKESYQLKNNTVSIASGQFFFIRNDKYFKATNTNTSNLTRGCCVNLNVENIKHLDSILNNDFLFEMPFSAVNTSLIGAHLHKFANNTSFNPDDINSIIPELSNLVDLFSSDIYEIGDNLSSVYKKKLTVKSILVAVVFTREYIYKNYKRKITLDNLVKVANLSKYHLLRLFSLAYGMSPLQLQQDLRIEASLGLIVSQNYSLTDVAISLGYTDLASFSNAFKSKIGVPPSKYLRSL